MITTASEAHGTRTLQDWDCPQAVDWPLLLSTLQHVKQHGFLPLDSFSKEDQNEIGPTGISDELIKDYHQKAVEWLQSLKSEDVQEVTIYLLDGFLLYPGLDNASTSTTQALLPEDKIPVFLPQLLDIKLYVRTRLSNVLARRGRRTGYVTLEGFWADPPGYIEEVVWPNYVKAHSWMFEDGDVDEGEVISEAIGAQGINMAPGKGERGMSDLLEWADGGVKQGVEGWLASLGKP